MKRNTKILSLMLSLLMLMTLFIPTASAYTKGETVYFEVEYAPEGFDNAIIEDEASAEVAWDAVFASMATQFRSHSEQINLDEFSIPKTEANKNTLLNFCWYYPQNLKGLSSVYFGVTTTKYLYIRPVYVYPTEKYNSMIDACEDAITTLLYGIKGNTALTDAEKCLILHDRLATWCEYDYDNYLTSSIPNESYCAYGPLVSKIGVCEGISLAYNWMMEELGIDSYYIASDEINHGWSMIYLDEQPYYIDVTHDDPVRDRVGRVKHDYFLVSFATYSATHNNVSDVPTDPVSTYYEENGFWTENGYLSAEAQIINGKIYYLSGGRIVERDCATESETTVKTVSDYWYAGVNLYYTDKYMGLASIGTKLIYNTPTQIRSYDTATREDKLVFAPDLSGYEDYTYIYGLTQKNGQIYYWLNTSPNSNSDNRGPILTYDYCTAHTSREILKTVTPATCTEDGEAKYICKDCRAVFTDEIPAAGAHSFTEFKEYTRKATCVVNAIGKYKCANCNATTEKEIEGSILRHAYSGEYSVTEKTHAQKCVNGCNTYSSPVTHSFDTFVGTKSPATCTTDRVDTYKCVCGATRYVTVAKTRTGHNYQPVTTEAPTCTKNGYTEYYCAGCNDTYLSDYVVATGHSDGNADGYCDDCGENISQASCSCGCHKTGISGFFFKIRLLFWKLFNVEGHRYCECGKAHW